MPKTDKGGNAAKPADADAAANSRFVEDGEGMSFNGMSVEEYLKHPATKAALDRAKATPPAAPKGDKKGDKK